MLPKPNALTNLETVPENSPLAKSPSPHALNLVDKDDPNSLIHILPPAVKTALESAYDKDPALFAMDERVLLAELRKRKQTPTISDNRLRMKFWNEYDRVRQFGIKEMSMTNVLSGLCSRPFFYDNYVKTPEHIAWLLCIPATYEVVMEEALKFGLEQLRDVLALPHVDKHGKVNAKLLELKAKIVDMIHVRVKGAVVQKNLNINASQAQVNQAAENLTMEEIQRRMHQIELRKAAAINGGSGKVVEPEIVGPEE